MSQSSASAKPPASAGPLTARDHRARAGADRLEGGGRGLDQALLVLAVAAELGHVHPRAEGRPGAGQHDAADAVVLAEAGECLAELDPQVDRQRVALLGALQGDKRHVLAAFDREQARHRNDAMPAWSDSATESPIEERDESPHHLPTFNTEQRREWVRITEDVQAAVDEAGIDEGMALVSAMHITAGVWVNDDEPGIQEDALEWLDKIAPPSWKPPSNEVAEQLLPEGGDYRHHRGGEDNGDAHLKNLLVHHQAILPVTEGKLDLGPWQQVFYAEFDGRRPKRLVIKVIGRVTAARAPAG